MTSDPESFCQLLTLLRQGNEVAEAELMRALYAELRELAGSYLRRERADHTLQPTEIVNEALLRLLGSDVEAENRVHFFALAASTMRRVLVDHARRRQAGKRFTPEDRVTLATDSAATPGADEVDVLDLHRALERYGRIAPRAAHLVELRYFGGLTLSEAAEAAGVSKATAARDWEVARIWLSGELSR